MQQLLYQITNMETLEDALAEIRASTPAVRPGAVLLHFFCGRLCDPDDRSCDEFLTQAVARTAEVLPEAELIGLSSGGEICRADQALYQAKQGGRNRVVVETGEEP